MEKVFQNTDHCLFIYFVKAASWTNYMFTAVCLTFYQRYN